MSENLTGDFLTHTVQLIVNTRSARLLGEDQNPEYRLRPIQPSDIVVDGYIVEQIDNFIGSAQSCDSGSQADIKRRIDLASSVISSLRRFWSDR